MKRSDTLTIEDILEEIMLEEAEPNHEALLRWCTRYPEHKEALTGFFSTWAVQKEQSDRPEIDEAHVGSRMVSHALNLLHKLGTPEVTENGTALDARLHRMIKASGIPEDEVMAQCGLDESLLAKLDRRLIHVQSIPAACIERLSKAIHCGAQDVVCALSGEPIPLASYKSKVKPAIRQENFLDAVATSDLADDIKKEWEQFVSSEKQTRDQSQ